MGTTLAKSIQPTQATASQEKLVICQSCGWRNPFGIKFYGNCGASLVPTAKVKCPKCGAEMPTTMKFCGGCRSPLKPKEIERPKCKTKNPNTNKFCGSYGAKLQQPLFTNSSPIPT